MVAPLATGTNGEYGGGAIFVHESALTVRDSSFIDNQAAPRPASSNSTGEALRMLLSDLTVARSTFSDNQASFGGAIYIDRMAPRHPARYRRLIQH